MLLENKFYQFLLKNNILATIIITILSSSIDELSISFIENIITPIITKDTNNDGVMDLQKLEDKKITLFGITLNIGKFFITALKFCLILIFSYIMFKIF